MTKNNLSFEDAFVVFVQTLSCNGCSFFKEKKCSHEKAIQNEKGKKEYLQYVESKDLIEHGFDVNNSFMCSKYKSKDRK